MAKAKRPVIIAGNWKMHKNIEDAVTFVQELAPAIEEGGPIVYIAAPYTAIQPVAAAAEGSLITIGAQNMNDASEGAFTGEIAALMIQDAGAKFVLLGHSERRHLFNETSPLINRKVQRALEVGLQPILCVGETLEEREAGQTEEVLATQIKESLAGVDKKALGLLILAYEPVWAIGTGKSASPEEAQAAHKFCRDLIGEEWGKRPASALPILYGGSVTPDNVHELIGQADINGVLVGGASLQAGTFAKIINYQTEKIS